MKRCFALLTMGLLLLSSAANAWYPSTVQVEFATATW